MQGAHYGNTLQAVSIEGPREGGTALVRQRHRGQRAKVGSAAAGGHAGVIEGICAIFWVKAEYLLVIRFCHVL